MCDVNGLRKDSVYRITMNDASRWPMEIFSLLPFQDSSFKQHYTSVALTWRLLVVLCHPLFPDLNNDVFLSGCVGGVLSTI